MYVLVETGGKQMKVATGDVVTVDKIDLTAGDKYTFDKVMMIADEGRINIGMPYIDGASVESEVIAQKKSRKLTVTKFIRRKRHLRMKSHRQQLTEVRIGKVVEA